MKGMGREKIATREGRLQEKDVFLVYGSEHKLLGKKSTLRVIPAVSTLRQEAEKEDKKN